ncbi:unnamed protein product [Arabidopsis halleri]
MSMASKWVLDALQNDKPEYCICIFKLWPSLKVRKKKLDYWYLMYKTYQLLMTD